MPSLLETLVYRAIALSHRQFLMYNCACESGIGSLKAYTHHQAAREGRSGEWTCDDLECARIRANTITRPRGHRQPTAEELWRARETVLADEREVFLESVEHQRERSRQELRDEKGADLGPRDLVLADTRDCKGCHECFSQWRL